MKDYWILRKHEYGQDEFLVAEFPWLVVISIQISDLKITVKLTSIKYFRKVFKNKFVWVKAQTNNIMRLIL